MIAIGTRRKRESCYESVDHYRGVVGPLLSQCQPRGSRLPWPGVMKVRQDLTENFARAIATSKTTSRRWSPKITVSAAVHVLAAARFAAPRGAAGVSLGWSTGAPISNSFFAWRRRANAVCRGRRINGCIGQRFHDRSSCSNGQHGVPALQHPSQKQCTQPRPD
jgi:hypothetical protein